MFGLGWFFPIVQVTMHVTQRIGAIFLLVLCIRNDFAATHFYLFRSMLCVVVINIVICRLLDHCTNYLATYFFDFFLFLVFSFVLARVPVRILYSFIHRSILYLHWMDLNEFT